MPKRWQFILTILAFCSGLLLVSIINTNQANQSDAATNPNADLIEIINRIETETAFLEETVESRREQIEKTQELQLHGVDQLSDLQGELTWLKRRTGLTQVMGPGVTVILDDNEAGAATAKAAEPYTFDPGNYIIHDKDLLYLVNDLKNGEAEAISINNQRIISVSDIRCVGTVILVNSTRLAPPYEVRAIGNQEKLEQAVKEGQIYPWLKAREFPIKFTIEDSLQLPSYKGSFQTSHLQLTKEAEETDEQN